MSNEETKAPEDHPNPKGWWQTIRRQAWIAQWALILQIPALIYFGLDSDATLPLVLVNLSLLASAAAYSGGSVLIDAIRAWKGNDE